MNKSCIKRCAFQGLGKTKRPRIAVVIQCLIESLVILKDSKKRARFKKYKTRIKAAGGNVRILGVTKACIQYGIKHNEFFAFEFWKKTENERLTYLGHWVRLAIDASLNQDKYAFIVGDKLTTYERLRPYFKRLLIPLRNADDVYGAEEVLKSRSWVIVKPRWGHEGIGIEFIDCSKLDACREALLKKVALDEYVLEDLIVQHPVMSQVYPKSVNTIRVVTVLKDDKVNLIRAAVRFGYNTECDNLFQGGLAAPVDLQTGEIYKPAISKIVATDLFEKHPITGQVLVGLIIPYWDEVVNLVIEMARRLPELRSVGWDIAITAEGPVLVEANITWCGNLIQQPHGEGVIPEILPFIDPAKLYPAHRKFYQNKSRSNGA